MSALSLPAHAKINWHLRILGKRSDGYHEIETVFQRIALHDDVDLQIAERDALIIEESPWPLGPPEKNLAWRALQSMRSEIGGDLPQVQIRLRKRIPPGAGLGGGSSDAAATLRGLNSLWNAGLDDAALMRIGAGLGADVAFLVSPWNCAVGRGMGDRVEPTEHGMAASLSIAFPGVPSATAAAYQAWDEAGLESKGPTVSGILDALQARDLEKVGRLVHNDFTEVLRRNHSGVAEAMAWLGEGESLRVWPTGSGSAVVALDGNRNRARQSAPPSHFSLFTSIATL